MKVVYIAGKFRGPTPWDVECNIRSAEHIAFEVSQMGMMPLCPHANTRWFHGSNEPEFWLRGTLELMMRCDAVVTVPGWTMSIGTKQEVRTAEDMGIPVFHTLHGLGAWLKDEERKQKGSSASTLCVCKATNNPNM